MTEVQIHYDEWFKLIDCEIGVTSELKNEDSVHQTSVIVCREIIYDKSGDPARTNQASWPKQTNS